MMSNSTTTMFKMLRTFGSMGTKLLSAQSRTPTSTITKMMVRIGMRERLQQGRCQPAKAPRRAFSLAESPRAGHGGRRALRLLMPDAPDDSHHLDSWSCWPLRLLAPDPPRSACKLGATHVRSARLRAGACESGDSELRPAH